MKKLLALVVVLGLVGVSSAAVSIVGPDKLAAGAVGTYTVDLSESIITFDWVLSLENAMGATIGNYVITAGNRNATLDFIDPATGEVSATQDAGTNPLVGPMLTFEVMAPAVVTAPFTAHVSMVDYYTANTDWALISPDMGSFAIEIPEPMTMSLLALGGLGLLRRRG